MKRSCLCLIGALAFLAGSQVRISAQLLLNESFAYPAGHALNGKAEGLGFPAGSAWMESYDFDTLAAPSLAYPRLDVAGNSLRSVAPTTGYTVLTRESSPIAGADGTVLWISFLMRKDVDGTPYGGPSPDYFGLTLYPYDADPDNPPEPPALFIGDTYETNFYSLGIAGSEADQAVSSAPSVVSTSATLLVVKITFRPGAELVELFVNPPVGPAPTTAPAASKSNLEIPDISALGILAGLDAQWSADEIRIGRTYVDVVRPYLRVASTARLPGGGVRVHCAGLPFQRHTVQATDNLAQPFTFFRSVTADANGNILFDDATTAGKRFYRVAYP